MVGNHSQEDDFNSAQNATFSQQTFFLNYYGCHLFLLFSFLPPHLLLSVRLRLHNYILNFEAAPAAPSLLHQQRLITNHLNY